MVFLRVRDRGILHLISTDLANLKSFLQSVNVESNGQIPNYLSIIGLVQLMINLVAGSVGTGRTSLAEEQYISVTQQVSMKFS